MKTLNEAMKEALDRIDARSTGNLSEVGVPTGYVDLDNLTAGLHERTHHPRGPAGHQGRRPSH